MPRTGIRVDGDFTKAKRQLKAVSRRTQNLTPVWPKVGRYLSKEVRKQFTTRGAHMGTPWQPLKPEYRAWKVAHGFNRNILVKTGDMRKEFTGRPMAVEIYHSDHAVFGSSSDKAKWMAGGTTRNGRPHVPARPIMPIGYRQRLEVSKILKDYIVGRAGREAS